ncbi:MAG: hypothetical protein ACRDCE_09465 [Cetobacterium sp.]|uniref:hypothetical protein n=1 Tax=Cetobacterium sp. TaxID=2071632 RepID=UPI003EE7E7CA
MFDLNALKLSGTETVKRHVSATGSRTNMKTAFNSLREQAAQRFDQSIGISHVGNSQAFTCSDSKGSITVVVGPINTGSDTWRIVINTTETIES